MSNFIRQLLIQQKTQQFKVNQSQIQILNEFKAYYNILEKYKSLNFAAGCSRTVIERGAKMLGYELDELIEKTILAMRSCEAEVAAGI